MHELYLMLQLKLGRMHISIIEIYGFDIYNDF